MKAAAKCIPTKLRAKHKFPWETLGWLVEFYSISTFVGYLTPNPFYANSSISNNSV